MVPRCSTTSRAEWTRLIPLKRGLANHAFSSATSFSKSMRSPRCGASGCAEVGVVGEAGAVALEGVQVGLDALPGAREVVVVEVQVEQVDVPGRLDRVLDVAGGDLAGDRQRGALRVVVHVAVLRLEQLPVLLGEQPLEQ